MFSIFFRTFLCFFFSVGNALASGTEIAPDRVPRIVTDVPAVHSVVSMVTEGVGAPGILLTKGASAHSFQLRPSQIQDLSDANLVVWVGPEMTPWLERPLEIFAKKAKILTLLHLPHTYRRFYHSEDSEDDHHTHDHDHDEGGLDPHAWLFPKNMAHWAEEVAHELTQLDPDHAELYTANANKAKAAIMALDQDLTELLLPARGKPIVVSHDAYGYFAQHYQLSLIDSIAAGDATAPGAKHLGHLQQEVASFPDHEKVCIFPEAQHDGRFSKRLAQNSGAKLGPALDPIGTTFPKGAGTYKKIMYSLAENILKCTSGTF